MISILHTLPLCKRDEDHTVPLNKRVVVPPLCLRHTPLPAGRFIHCRMSSCLRERWGSTLEASPSLQKCLPPFSSASQYESTLTSRKVTRLVGTQPVCKRLPSNVRQQHVAPASSLCAPYIYMHSLVRGSMLLGYAYAYIVLYINSHAAHRWRGEG